MTSADFAPKHSFPQIWGFSPKNTPCLSDVVLAGIVMVQYNSRVVDKSTFLGGPPLKVVEAPKITINVTIFIS